MWEIEGTHKGKPYKWSMVSRKQRPVIHAHNPDAVVIVAFCKNKIVVTKEFRPPLGDYEYGFPAGLIDEGETPEQAATREFKEETGLDIKKIRSVSKPVFSSAGLCDESVILLIVDAGGKISPHLEDSEDIETFLMSRRTVKNLLQKNVKLSAKAWPFLHLFSNGNI